MLNSKNVQQFIDQRHIQATILHLAEDTPTVPAAAEVLGVSPDQIIKTMVFLVQDKPLLMIANGPEKIDLRLLARHLGVGRKRVKLASPADALAITGYVVGSMPPFGHKIPLPTYITASITTLPIIYGGGGDIHAMLKLTPQTLLAITQGKLMANN